MTIRPLAMFILALGALAVPASATSVYCTGCGNPVAHFATDTAGLSMTALTFSASVNPATGYTELGVNFTDLLSGDGSHLSTSAGSLIDNHTPVPGMNVTLPGATTAVSFFVVGNSGGTITINGSNVPNTPLNMTGSPVFFGALAGVSTNITSFTITSTSPVTISSFDIFSESGASAPEASTLVLIGSGLLALGFLGRRRVHKPDGPLA